ncbi:transposase [Sphingomonas sp. 37zxx]|uniref:transposase n=1 Tax=Sphingomonas sp. 37zxx TaxID=1550073 RepID=UPI000A683CAD
MTVPGVGPIVALAFASMVDEPERFAKSKSVGAYFGLTPRRYQSGEKDVAGSISRTGDTLVRSCLFEAANVLMTRVKRWTGLKVWGVKLARRIGINRARAAVARKMGVITQDAYHQHRFPVGQGGSRSRQSLLLHDQFRQRRKDVPAGTKLAVIPWPLLGQDPEMHLGTRDV